MPKQIYLMTCMVVAFALVSAFASAVNCTNLTTTVVIDIDPQPYVSTVTSFFATVPNPYHTTEFKCWSYIKADGEVIQTNPQKTEVSKSKLLLFSKRTEDREYFTSQDGVVNAYFTYDNLVSYTEFVLGVRCVSGDISLVGEKCITPQYKELKGIPARGVWTVENMDMIIAMVFVLLIIIFLFFAIISRR